MHWHASAHRIPLNGRTTQLKRTAIPDSAIRLKGSVFADFHRLESVILPINLHHISYDTFWHCTSLETLYYSDYEADLHTGVICDDTPDTSRTAGNITDDGPADILDPTALCSKAVDKT